MTLFIYVGKHFTLINNNHCDLRQCNILPFKQGMLNSPELQQKIETLKKALPVISGKSDTVTTRNSKYVQIIEYGEKILILENEKLSVN